MVSLPTRAFSSHLEMRATSNVGKEARIVIEEKLELIFYGVDVGLNHHRHEANSRVNFVYKIYKEIDSMSIEDIREYEKRCLNILKELIQNDEPNTSLVCVTVSKFFMHLRIVFL